MLVEDHALFSKQHLFVATLPQHYSTICLYNLSRVFPRMAVMWTDLCISLHPEQFLKKSLHVHFAIDVAHNDNNRLYVCLNLCCPPATGQAAPPSLWQLSLTKQLTVKNETQLFF